MKTINTDIAIMGCGLAGLTAAVTALEQGAKVAVFEKRPFQGGGVSNTPMCTLAVRDDQEYKDKAFKIHMDYTNWNANPAVVRSWIDISSKIPGFIRGLGIEFLNEKLTPIEEIGEKRGYSSGIGDFCIGAYDAIADFFRGATNMMTDLYRHGDKVLEVLDKFTVLTLRTGPLWREPSSGGSTSGRIILQWIMIPG
jgi:hypothetical protein